ncbi:hypothetical protein D1003_11055 [Riemerella anatipestifer]|nr:hypothetical protein [Riemerella anatipestifer]
MKKHLLWFVEIELFVQFSPPFANTFSVVRYAIQLSEMTEEENVTYIVLTDIDNFFAVQNNSMDR